MFPPSSWGGVFDVREGDAHARLLLAQWQRMGHASGHDASHVRDRPLLVPAGRVVSTHCRVWAPRIGEGDPRILSIPTYEGWRPVYERCPKGFWPLDGVVLWRPTHVGGLVVGVSLTIHSWHGVCNAA